MVVGIAIVDALAKEAATKAAIDQYTLQFIDDITQLMVTILKRLVAVNVVLSE